MCAMNIDEDTETKSGVTPAQVRDQLKTVADRVEQVENALDDHPWQTEIEELKTAIANVSQFAGEADNQPWEGLIDKVNERVDELAAKTALGTMGDKLDGAPEGFKTIVDNVANSPTYKSMFDAEGRPTRSAAPMSGWSKPTSIKSFAAARAEEKAVTPVSLSDLSGLNLTAYRPGIVTPPMWAMRLGERIPSQIVRGATSYTVVKEDGASVYGAWTSTLDGALNGDPTPVSTCTLNEIAGLPDIGVLKFWNSDDSLAGEAAIVSINTGTKVVTVTTNAIDFDLASGSRVTCENYGVIAEKAAKPSGWVGIGNDSFSMKMIPVIIPTTENALATVTGLRSFIEGKAPMRDMRNMSRHLLYGDDSSIQLQGLTTYTGAQTYSWSDGVAGDNQVDAIIRSASLIPWTGLISVIMKQADMPDLWTLKGDDGHYLQSGNFGNFSLSLIGGSWYLGAFELFHDDAVTSGDFIPINFAEASEIADADMANLAWGYEDDDFSKNIIRCRYEALRAHAIKSVEAYVSAQWDGAP